MPEKACCVCLWYQVVSRCQYCRNRLVGVCPVVSRCVDIVRIDMSVCVFGTKWPAGVSILSEKACRCGSMVPSGQIGASILSEYTCR